MRLRIVWLGLFVCAAAYGQQNRVNQLVTEWTRAKLGTQEYIDAMPEEGIAFKPAPEIRSFAGQMLHIADTLQMFAAFASKDDNPWDPARSQELEKMAPSLKKAELRRLVLGAYDRIIATAKGPDDAWLDQPVQFFKTKMPRYLLLAKALEHHAHHRGQTTIYLRLKGITPPSERLF